MQAAGLLGRVFYSPLGEALGVRAIRSIREKGEDHSQWTSISGELQSAPSNKPLDSHSCDGCTEDGLQLTVVLTERLRL